MTIRASVVSGSVLISGRANLASLGVISVNNGAPLVVGATATIVFTSGAATGTTACALNGVAQTNYTVVDANTATFTVVFPGSTNIIMGQNATLTVDGTYAFVCGPLQPPVGWAYKIASGYDSANEGALITSDNPIVDGDCAVYQTSDSNGNPVVMTDALIPLVTEASEGNPIGTVDVYLIDAATGDVSTTESVSPVQADTVDPDISGGPTAINIAENSADISVTVSESCRVYCLVLHPAATQPSQAAMEASPLNIALQELQAGTLAATGLTPNTQYRAWVMAKDWAGNVTFGVSNTFTTDAGNQAPSVYAPDNTTLIFEYEAAGLAHSDTNLQTLLDGATANDPEDGVLVPTHNLASFPDPLTEGTYTIVYTVTDSGGLSGSDSFDLTVQRAAQADVVPTVPQLPADVVNAEPNSVHTFEFLVQGVDPGYDVQYSSSGRIELSKDGGITWTTAITTQLSNVIRGRLIASSSFNTKLTGTVTCLAGSDSFAVTTRAQVVPTVVTHPQSVTVNAGSAVALVAAFTNGVSYQWYKDSVAIVGATGTTYSPQSTPNSSGDYYCRATSSDGVGVNTNVATVVINAVASPDPVIILQPETTTVTEGEPVSFYVDANNAIGYQWYMSGVIQPGETAMVFTIDETTLDQNLSEVRVVVFGGNGTNVTSSPAFLRVDEKDPFEPPDVIITPRNRIVTLKADRTVQKDSFSQDPDELMDYLVDISHWLTGNSDTMVEATIKLLTPGIEIEYSRFDAPAGTLLMFLSGGAEGRTYQFEFEAETATGRIVNVHFEVSVATNVY